MKSPLAGGRIAADTLENARLAARCVLSRKPLPNDTIFQLVGTGQRPVPINVAAPAEEIGSERPSCEFAAELAANK